MNAELIYSVADHVTPVTVAMKFWMFGLGTNCNKQAGSTKIRVHGRCARNKGLQRLRDSGNTGRSCRKQRYSRRICAMCTAYLCCCRFACKCAQHDMTLGEPDIAPMLAALARNPKQPARNPKQPAPGRQSHLKSRVGRSQRPAGGSGVVAEGILG